MLFANFPDFASCVLHMRDVEHHPEEESKSICGKMQADEEGHKGKAKMSAMLTFPQGMLNFTECPKTGDTIFHDVTLMSEGTWTDSLNKKPLEYSANEVAAMNFKKMSFKAQHDIYGELPLTNEIGVIENAKLSLNPAKWKGDVRIYPTALGKDIATLIKRKQITDISPEFFFEEILDGSKPAGIMFMGAATVRKGACRVCTFNEGIETDVIHNGDKEIMTEGTPPNIGGTAANGGVTVELNSEQKQRIAALEQEIKEKQNASSAAFLADVESIKKENAILKDQVATLSKQLAQTDYQKRVAELEHQVKAISNQPVIHTTISAGMGGRRVAAELDTGEFPIMSIQEFE